MTPIRGVVFDADGTVVHDYRYAPGRPVAFGASRLSYEEADDGHVARRPSVAAGAVLNAVAVLALAVLVPFPS